MIPSKFLSKMGVYEFQIRGVPLKIRVADDPDVVDIGISELISQFGTTVVGINFRSSPRTEGVTLLELCVGTRCLIVQMAHLAYSMSLVKFLEDQDVCFVGVNMAANIKKLQNQCAWYGAFQCKTGVELSDLVARFLTKPNLGVRGLQELAREVGVDLKEEPAAKVSVDWTAKILSEEEIKYAVRDAHASYLIGKKIFG